MRLPLWFALYVAIAVALNPVDDDIQPFDSNDLFADLGATEFFPVKDLDPFESLDAIDLVSIPSSGSSSVLASSCLTRNELPSGRLRARDEKSCVIPFEGLPTGFDDISNMIDGSASEETLPEDSLLELPAVDAPKSFNCLPNFPYHVCCDQRGPTSDDFPSMPVLVYKYLLRCDIASEILPCTWNYDACCMTLVSYLPFPDLTYQDFGARICYQRSVNLIDDLTPRPRRPFV